MTPLQRYSKDVDSGSISADFSQAEAAKSLQRVYDELLQKWQRPMGLWQTFMDALAKNNQSKIKGLYFWGGVGRGKTYLMDLFYQCLPSDRKMRVHFHRFMQMVHHGLTQHKGEKDPLKLVALDITQKIDVLCFDEFFVSDIGDAMILANLLEFILAEGVTLIATSNIPPSQLYKDGLQRERFMPAIELIENHTKVFNLDGGVDYRLRTLEKAEIFHSPLDDLAEQNMMACFKEMSSGAKNENNSALSILGREIAAKCWVSGIAWFEFSALCEGPRSAADYVEISQLFHTVMLSNVPLLSGKEEEVRRFINLVDELYDHNVKLIMSAAVPLNQLYEGSELQFPFERTLSRLLEMQSYEYLSLEHKP